MYKIYTYIASKIPFMGRTVLFLTILFVCGASAANGECLALSNNVAGGSTHGAVILYKGAKYAMEASLSVFSVRKSYHKKILLNSEAGIKYTEVSIPYYRFMEYSERVGGIRVEISNGEYRKLLRMEKDMVEDIKKSYNFREKRFTIPGVNPGDTVDIKYDIVGMFPQYHEKQQDSLVNTGTFGFNVNGISGEDIIFPKWYFQEEVPVLHSELELSYFDEFRFETVLTGAEKITIYKQDGGEYKILNRMVVPRKHFTLSTLTDPAAVKTNLNSHLSVFKDYFTIKHLKTMKLTTSSLPALYDAGDKYVINPQKYRVSAEFDFKGKYSLEIGNYEYSNSWTNVNKILFDSHYFGSRLFYMQDFYKSFADSVKTLSIPDYDKVKMICRYISDDIECVSSNGGMYINNPREVFVNKRGSNVDICAIAYNTLKKAGFKVRMVMLKSRDAGHLYSSGISISAFNTVVLHITAKDNHGPILFDPTGNPGNMDLINPMNLVKEGIVYNNGEERANLMNIVENKEFHNAVLFVDDQGMVSGNCKSVFTNHSAFEMEGKRPHVNGETVQTIYGTLDSISARYNREFDFRRTSSVLVDDKIFISPYAEKFFSPEEFAHNRQYPVEFRNPKTIEYRATIHIPDGYEVYSLPVNSISHQHRCGAKATIMSKAHGNIVMLGLTIRLDNATIPLEHYRDFQQWWLKMCSLLDEIIVFRRKGSKSITDTEQMTV